MTEYALFVRSDSILNESELNGNKINEMVIRYGFCESGSWFI